MDSVIDLPKAEEHLRLAARYAQSEIRQLPDAAKFCGEAYFHASIACYAQSNNRLLTDGSEVFPPPAGGQRGGDSADLREMLDLAHKSIQAYPEIPEAFYHHAKYAALLGERETCVQSLKRAILMERNYCLKADADGDFDGVRESVLTLEDSLRNEAKTVANATYQGYRRQLDAILPNLPSDTRREAEGDCRRIEAYLARDTYFDYQDVLPEIQLAEGKLLHALEEARREEQQERRRREEREEERRAAELRAYRRRNKLCLECGAKLGFLDRLGGRAYCERHRVISEHQMLISKLQQSGEWAVVEDLLRKGAKIPAIKEFRALTGLGLKEAKDLVEAVMMEMDSHAHR